MIHKKKKRKEFEIMTNEMIKKYVGKNCKISNGAYGSNATGEIIYVNEIWIEIETK